MPGPMPPQGGPPPGPPPGPPAGGPPPGAGAPPPSGGQDSGAGSISALLTNVDKAIDHLNMVIGQSKAASPAEKQMISQVDSIYGKLMGSLGLQGGGDEDDGPPDAPGAQGQTVPPEAGGNKGAMPSPM